MYVPKLFSETDTDTLVAFMRRHSFATVVSSVDSVLHASHLPLTVHHNEDISLRGHFARANPQWRTLETGETLVVFTGPHAYVSPEQYSKRESVPTWNYLAVHAYGEARLVQSEDRAALETTMADLITQHEPSYQAQWDNLPERYKAGMMQGIVAFELRVTRLEGAAKLSQNKSRAEQERIAEALLRSGDPDAVATGTEMRRHVNARGER